MRLNISRDATCDHAAVTVSTTLPLRRYLPALQNMFCFGEHLISVKRCISATNGGALNVNLAIKLDTLAVFAVFAFVGAVVFGAF
jgi:hypothetical protein